MTALRPSFWLLALALLLPNWTYAQEVAEPWRKPTQRWGHEMAQRPLPAPVVSPVAAMAVAAPPISAVAVKTIAQPSPAAKVPPLVKQWDKLQPTPTPTIRRLQLLAMAPPQSGIDGDLGIARARLISWQRLGHDQVALDWLRDNVPDLRDPLWASYAEDLLLQNRLQSACLYARAGDDVPAFNRLAAYCALASDKAAAQALAVTLPAGFYRDAVAALASASALPPLPPQLDPLSAALLSDYKPQLDITNHAPAALLNRLGLYRPGRGAAAILVAAEARADLGKIGMVHLMATYDHYGAAIANSNGALFIAARSTPDPSGRAGYIRRASLNSDNLFSHQLLVRIEQIHMVRPVAGAAWFAPDAALALSVEGDHALAEEWFALGKKHGSAKTRRLLDGLLPLMAMGARQSLTEAEQARFTKAAPELAPLYAAIERANKQLGRLQLASSQQSPDLARWQQIKDLPFLAADLALALQDLGRRNGTPSPARLEAVITVLNQRQQFELARDIGYDTLAAASWWWLRGQLTE